nr:glycosyltransferase [Shewanella corallii]
MPSGKIRMLYVGRLIKDKGAQIAVEVQRKLEELGLDVELNFVGDIYPSNPSSFTNSDISKIKEEFGGRVKFHGFTDDVIAWYENSDLLLLPSVREGFPVCVMEASMVGIPTFGFSVPGMRDAIVCGVNGQLVSEGDLDDLVESIRFAANKIRLAEFYITAQEYAISNFDRDVKSNYLVSMVNTLSCKRN